MNLESFHVKLQLGEFIISFFTIAWNLGSRWLTVALGGSRWLSVALGGSRWLTTNHMKEVFIVVLLGISYGIRINLCHFHIFLHGKADNTSIFLGKIILYCMFLC